ncbi:hypothetical protein VNO77_38955 [Canavalia gladiata]|uniref:Uncharacterized protein n=1 Tax=Canavalia gladiata TaxID=3824 RepID=A0AAN9PXB5_CANGL
MVLVWKESSKLEDKQGGNPINFNHSRGFQEAMDDYGLNRFTWCNERTEPFTARERPHCVSKHHVARLLEEDDFKTTD